MNSILDVCYFNSRFPPTFHIVFCHTADFLLEKKIPHRERLLPYPIVFNYNPAADKIDHLDTPNMKHLFIPARTQTRETTKV